MLLCNGVMSLTVHDPYPHGGGKDDKRKEREEKDDRPPKRYRFSTIGLDPWEISQKDKEWDKKEQDERDAIHKSILYNIETNRIGLHEVEDRWQDNTIIVHAAVKRDGLALEFATPRLRNHFNIVDDAFKQNPEALRYASDAITTQLVDYTPKHLKYASDTFQKAYIQETWVAIQDASDKIKDDLDFIKPLILQHWAAFPFVSERLKDDFDFVKEIIDAGNPLIFEHVSDRLKDDIVIATEAVKGWPHNLRNASFNRRSQVLLVLIAIQQDGICIQYGAPFAQDDRALAKIAIDNSTDEEVLGHLSERLRDDADIVLYATAKTPNAIEYIGLNLRQRPDFWLRLYMTVGPDVGRQMMIQNANMTDDKYLSVNTRYYATRVTSSGAPPTA